MPSLDWHTHYFSLWEPWDLLNDSIRMAKSQGHAMVWIPSPTPIGTDTLTNASSVIKCLLKSGSGSICWKFAGIKLTHSVLFCHCTKFWQSYWRTPPSMSASVPGNILEKCLPYLSPRVPVIGAYGLLHWVIPGPMLIGMCHLPVQLVPSMVPAYTVHHRWIVVSLGSWWRLRDESKCLHWVECTKYVSWLICWLDDAS